MTIFGLNSPELFLLLVITLVILGIKRIEKGLDLLSRLLKFLLSNQRSIDKKAQKKEPIKNIEEIQTKASEIIKIKEKPNAKEEEPIKRKEETQANDDKSKKTLKIASVDKKENKPSKIKDKKGIEKDKTAKKVKTKSPKRIVKDKTVIKSKTINVQEEQLEK